MPPPINVNTAFAKRQPDVAPADAKPPTDILGAPSFAARRGEEPTGGNAPVNLHDGLRSLLGDAEPDLMPGDRARDEGKAIRLASADTIKTDAADPAFGGGGEQEGTAGGEADESDDDSIFGTDDVTEGLGRLRSFVTGRAAEGLGVSRETVDEVGQLLLETLPGVGNIMSGREAAVSFMAAVTALESGNGAAALQHSAETILNGLGAVPGGGMAVRFGKSGFKLANRFLAAMSKVGRKGKGGGPRNTPGSSNHAASGGPEGPNRPQRDGNSSPVQRRADTPQPDFELFDPKRSASFPDEYAAWWQKTGRNLEAERVANRSRKIERAESWIWNNLKYHNTRGGKKTMTNGLRGKKERLFQWDGEKGEIEVYTRKGTKGHHIGVMDPLTGTMIKSGHPGRKIEALRNDDDIPRYV